MRTSLLTTAPIAALLALIPLLLVTPAGDAVMNYAQISCFSEHLWSGRFYPRWCMEANGGMGSPGPIFYFPLPFYIAAIFAPLKSLGLTVDGQYLIGVFLANIVAFVGCTRWLAPRTGERVAMLAAFLLLWSGYRSELLTRTSYAEFWCVSLLPWLFLLVRKLCDGGAWRTWLPLSGLIAILILAHTPVAIIGLIGAGVFMLVYARDKIRALAELIFSALLAAFATLFHLLPMKLLTDTLNPEMGGYIHWQKSWVNSFINSPAVVEKHEWALAGLAVNLLLSACVFAAFLYKRHSLPADARHEAFALLAMAGVAFFMLFSVSAPLWWPVAKISGVMTPWRMPSLIMLAMIGIGALMVAHVWSKRKTARGDAVGAGLLFIFIGLFYAGGVNPESLSVHRELVRSQYVILHFATKDLNKRYHNTDLFFADFIQRKDRKQAEWISGAGEISVTKWQDGEIRIEGNADRAGVLRLEHFYYPIWQAELNDSPIEIQAEPDKGRMLIRVPKGKFSVILREQFWPLLRERLGKIL